MIWFMGICISLQMVFLGSMFLRVTRLEDAVIDLLLERD